jgi:predicted GNAT family N-acyltransferase
MHSNKVSGGSFAGLFSQNKSYGTIMQIRPLAKSDYYNGFMDVINCFTRNPTEVTYEQFCTAYDEVVASKSHVFVALSGDTVVGTIKIIIEKKFHNNLKSVGHIEDVVVDPGARGSGVARAMIEFALQFIRENFTCYKVILSCNDGLVDFYKKFSFEEKGKGMSIYYV